MELPTPKKLFKKPKLTKKAIIVAIVVLALIGISGYTYAQYRGAQDQINRLSNPQAAAKAESESLVQKVGQIVQLPSGETPTVASVVDASKLKNQAFFAHAENGDKVLLYTTAKKAYLYRPSTNKLIEVAPIDVGTPQSQTATPSSTKK